MTSDRRHRPHVLAVDEQLGRCSLDRRPAGGQHPVQVWLVDSLHTLGDGVETVTGPGDNLVRTSRRGPEKGHVHDDSRGQPDEAPLHVLSFLSPVWGTGSIPDIASPCSLTRRKATSGGQEAP